jgi:acyl carrier protein
MLQSIIGGTPVCYLITIRGVIDLKKMEESLHAVIKAHPALQLAFEIPFQSSSFGQWKVKFVDIQNISINFQDISNAPFEERILLEYNNLLNKKNSLNQWPLYEFKLFKTGINEYRLFMEMDHVIADGLGNLQILHEWLACYAGLEQPVKYSIESYVDTISKINAYRPSEKELSSFHDFVMKTKKESYNWNPHHRTLPTLVPNFKTVMRKIPSTTIKKWTKIAETLRISFYAIIVTAYVEVFFRKYENGDKIIFTLPTGGKVYPDIDASPYVGCFAQALTLAFSKELMQQSLQERLVFIHEKIHFAIQTGTDRIQTQKMAQSIRNDFKLNNGELTSFGKTLFRSSIKSNLYISYLGYSPLKKTYGAIEILDYKEGTFNNAGVCDFVHTIFNEELYLFGNYDAHFFEHSLIEEVLNDLSSWFNTLDPELSPTLEKGVKKEVDNQLIDYLLHTFASIYKKELNRDQLDHDLESKLGLDSLGRIRLVTRISKDYQHKLNLGDFFKCRTLLELAHALQDSTLQP